MTLACQNVGTMVAQAVLSARSADGVALWTPLSLSLNAPLSVSPLSGPAGSYTLTANNNGSNLSAQVAVNVSGSLAKPSAAATPDLNLVPSSEVVNITNTFPSNPLPLSAAALALLVAGGVSGGVPIPSVYGNVTGGAAHGWARTAAQVFDNAISEALYDIAPWGSYTPGSPPGVPAYSLAPQLAAASGFAVSPQAAAAAWAASAAGAPLAAPPAQPLAGDAQAALTVAASSASYNQSAQATQRAFFWRGGAGSYGCAASPPLLRVVIRSPHCFSSPALIHPHPPHPHPPHPHPHPNVTPRPRLSGTFSAIAAQALNGANATYGLLQTAQLFAQLHSAIADAQAAAWTLKQAHLTPRPETVVGASAAPGWRPLLNNPPYPAFPSAHASMCSAAVAVLQSFFQGDAIPTPTGTLRYVSTDSWQLGSVKVATQTPGTSAFPSANFTYSILPNSTNTITSRAWTNFSQIAADCGQSRVDGGVQFSSSVAAGASLGAAVAVDVLAAFPMWASTAPGTVGAAMPAVWNYFAGVGGVGGSGYGGVPSPASSAAPASAPTVLALLLLTTFAALLV